MKHATAVLVALAFLASAAFAASKYVRVAEGSDFEFAKAKCELMSMGVGQDYMVWGSPAYVAGYSIGAAIGNAIQQQMFIERCMVLHGWKKVKVAATRAKVKTNYNSGGAEGRENR